MSVEQAIILAIVQGVTEFLPISSSGHLVLSSWIFNWPDQGLVFDAAVHLGTLAAVIIYFRRTWITLASGCFSGGAVFLMEDGETSASVPARRLLALIVIATIPVAALGLVLQSSLESSLRKPETVAISLLATAGLLTLAEVFGARTKRLADATWRDTTLAGLFQAVAVIPGVSRAGSTMAGGMLGNLSRDAAARLSFLLAVPAIGGSGVFLLIDVISAEGVSGRPWGLIMLGAAISFGTGYLAIAWLMRVLRTRSFRPFIVYVALLGTAVLIARALGA
ncbi:MAG: undecaprenyl-diphosphate phosphatase [Chloroflexi bacterium]|nr:undecaprenyl-diphosphate phosphatase [Chloroflexota bacterium]MDA1296923.1 undecaprenyl-diphosphate phosphatase [Chloroflexota bacterium]